MRELLLARFPVFRDLPAASLDELLAQSEVMRMPRGSVLFEPGQPCRGFPLVLEGGVRVATRSAGGREIVLYRVDAGQSCLLSGGCLLGHSDYSARGVAEEDVTVLRIPPDLFQRLMVEFEPFRRFVFSMYGERLAEVMQLVDEVAFHRLDQRLALLLIHRGPVVNATHQEVADDLGSVREIVSRLLRSFESRGWVQLERERITVLEPKALADYTRAP